MAKNIPTEGWDVLPGEEIFSTEERRSQFAGLTVDREEKCSRPSCHDPLWLHDTNAEVPGGACLCGGCKCPQFM